MDITLTSNRVHNFEVPAPEYDVIYEINGHGEQPENLTKVGSLPDSLPELKETGYIFEGWYTDADLTQAAVEGSEIKKNTTLYAKWFEGTISDIKVPKGISYEKNESGEQVISYSKTPGWQTFDIKVVDYDPTNTILEVVFEASSDITICFQINGKIDWSLGHIERPGERKCKITIDLS